MEGNEEQEQEILEDKVTVQEVAEIIQGLDRGKAMGFDDIPNEFMLEGGELVAETLVVIFNKAIESRKVATSWKRSYTQLLHKGGDKGDLDNYRGIAVTSNVGKVFTKVLGRRLEESVEDRGLLGNIQFGFRRGKRATDALFILTQVMEMRKKAGKKIALAFLDVKKAYDRVWREGLWQTMRKWGYGGIILDIIQDLYAECDTVVRLGQYYSDPVKLEVGLKQGCVLSPLLFAIYIMELGHELENSILGVKVGGVQIPALFFADDIVLLGEDEVQLQRIMNIVGEFGVSRKLIFNPLKSKVMVNWRRPEAQKSWVIGKQKVREGTSYIVRLEECEAYTYLGVKVATRGRMFRRFELDRLQKAKVKGGMARGFSRGSFNAAFCAKVIWERVMLPALMYGVEVVASSKTWVGAMGKEELKIGKFITGASRSCAILAINGEIGWLPFHLKIAKAKLTYARRFEWADEGWGKEVWEQGKLRNTNWWKEVGELSREYEVDLNHEESESLWGWKSYVKNCLDLIVCRQWQEGVEEKESLVWLRRKENPQWETYLNGSAGAKALFKLRTNDWDCWLRRKSRDGERQQCRLCGTGEESNLHIVGSCPYTAEWLNRGDAVWGADVVLSWLNGQQLGVGNKWASQRRAARLIIQCLRDHKR